MAVAALLLPAAGARAAAMDPVGARTAAAVGSPAVSAPADMIVGESDGSVDLVVRLSAPGTNTVSVHYSTSDSSAFASLCPFDYGATSGTLTFAPGELAKSVPVTINDCTNVENLESFTFNLTSPVNSTIARSTTRVEIVDNDTVVATPRIVVRDAIVDEAGGDALVSVLLGGPRGQASGSTVTVDYSTVNGTASAAGDYTATSGTLTFTPGQTAKTVAIPVADDAVAEPGETFALELADPANATIADDTGIATIGASDAPAVGAPAVSAPPDVIVDEDDGYVDLTVRLAAPGTDTSSVHYSTADSSAFASLCPFDYSATSGTLTFLPGQTTRTVRIDIYDCTNVESLESFTVGLSSPVNTTIARGRSRVEIVDNDTVVATPRIVVRDAVVDEADGDALVSVLLGGSTGQASGSTVTVDYSTVNGTASAGSDYTATSGTLTFAPGETAKTVAIPIADDAAAEPGETFALELADPANATIADDTGDVSVGANDAPAVGAPAVSAPADAIVDEDDGFADLTVRLSRPGTDTVSVNYSTADSSAFASLCPFDYSATSGTLTFLPGQTTRTVRVDIYDCTNVESLESFTFSLSSPVNTTIARGRSRVEIVDNDTVVATPRIVVRDAVVDEADGNALVSVLLGGPRAEASGSTVKVDYATADGTAIAAGDYTATSGTLTFAPRETAKTVVIPIADDGGAEPKERFALRLADPANATIADDTGIVTIGANDTQAVGAPAVSAPPNAIVDEDDGYVDLTVRLAAPGTDTVSVNYSTADSSAFASLCPFDYSATSGTLTFLPGQTTRTVRIDIYDCTNVESLESFTFNLSSPVNTTIARASTRVTIVDSSLTLTSIAVTPANSSVAPGADAQLTATGTYSNGASVAFSPSVTWSSANPAIATVDDEGVAHGVAEGATTVTATLGAISGSTALTVKQPPAPPPPSPARKDQAITFAKLANKTAGDPDFVVGASASSGLPVAFAASGNCSVSGADVHLTGPGSCTLTASQAGNAEFAPAPDVSQTFTIAPKAVPAPLRCTVPNVVGKKLAGARSAIVRRRCRVGKVTRVFSRRRKKGRVISQSRRPGKQPAANSKINLVVSRGRRAS